jgi:hypothetical protein
MRVEVKDYLGGEILDVRDLARDTRPYRVQSGNGIVYWKAEWGGFRNLLGCSVILRRWIDYGPEHNGIIRQTLGNAFILSWIGYLKFRLAVRAWRRVNGLPHVKTL